MFCLRPALCAVIVLSITACATPRNSGLTTEVRTALDGKMIADVIEPQPQGVRRIKKPQFRAVGGGLIGLGVVLAASAITAAAENIASDIDEVPVPTLDMAAELEQRLIVSLVEQTKLQPAEVSLSDAGRKFSQTDEGRAAAVAAAKSKGMDGILLNVRTLGHGVVSEGAVFKSGTERFGYHGSFRAELLDIQTGDRLAWAVCTHSSVMGTLQDVQKADINTKKLYSEALSQRETSAQLLEQIQSGAADGTEEQITELEETLAKELPPTDNSSRHSGFIVKACHRNLLRELLKAPKA